MQVPVFAVVLDGGINPAQTCALTFLLDKGSPVNLDCHRYLILTNVYHQAFFNAFGLSVGTHTFTWTIQISVVNTVAVIDYAVIISDNMTSSVAACELSSRSFGS